MKTTFTLGLRGRLILLIVVAFTVIFAMIVQHTIAHRAEEIANATTHLLHNAKLIAARQQQIQTRAEAILNDLMTRAELRSDVSIKSCEKFLAARAKQEAAFLQIGKVLPNGDLACTAHPAAGRVNLADWDWFQSVLKSENMVVSGALTSRSVNQPTVVFAKAVRNDAGQVTSVLFLSLDLSWLRQELSTDGLQEGTRLVAVDSSGIVLVRHPDGDDDRADKSIAQTPLFQAVTAKSYQGTIEERGLDGLPRIVAFTPLLETVSGPMILWLSVPKAVVEASTQRELTTSLSVAATVLLLVIALVIWGGEKLVLFPLRRLLLAVTRFGSGDLSARTGLPRTEDDIGRLAQSFDIMAESVQASEARFRAVAEASLDALFILRSVRGEQGEILDFEFTDLNPRAEQMLDMARDKVVGQKLCELLPVNRTGGFFDKYVAVATTGTPLEEEFPIDIPEIKAKWVRHQVVRVGDGIAISSRDITQWKKMSAEIRRQGKLRKQIMSSVGEGIFGLDTEGRATFVNPAATAMLQWSEKELVGQPMHALHHHTRADGTPYPGKECPIYEAYRDGKVHRVDNEVFWRNDGTSFPVEYVSTPIFDDQGVLTGAVVSFTDISARKQAEQILHDSEERFRVTIENIRDAFVLINGEDERILLWNPAAEEMFGYSQEEIIGQPMHHLIVPPRFHEAAYAGLARFTQTGEGAAVGRTNELMALRRDGAEFPVEMALSAMQIGGKWHAAGLVRDISQRKAQEQALKHTVRTLKTLSEINQALVRANDEAQLLQEVCQGIVEKGGYRMAWVAFADDNPEKTITAKAWAGIEEDYLTRLHLTWADTERGQGPTSRAIRSGEMQTTHDIRSDPGFALWRELAEEHGFRSNFSYPLSVAGKVIGALGIYATEADAFDETETQLLTELGGDLAFGIETLRTRIQRDHIAHQHEHHAEILRHTLEEALDAIATTVEMRDPYTAGHERRVSELAVAIAQEMGLEEDKIHGIRLAATVHDLGKINVPAEILSKPGKLSDIEFMLIKTHPQAGYDILKDVEFPWPIADIVLQHHERLDGTGYPQGLKNGQILLESRIMAVADVTEAMASHRPYRAGLGVDIALNEIERGKGSAYDPAVADACIKLFREGRFAFQVGM